MATVRNPTTYRNTNRCVRLRSSQVPDGFLGGLPDSTVSNNIPVDSFYASLPRLAPAALPGVHSGCKTFANNELKEAYMKIYTGDFTMSWGVQHNPDGAYDQELFIVAALDDDDGVESTRFRGNLFSLVFHASSTGYKFESDVSRYASLFSQDLTVDQKQALTDRILHHFVRARGALEHENVYYGIIRHLQSTYPGKRYWKENTDAAMIAADIVFNAPFFVHQSIILTLVRVCEALEANGRFREAGKLYEEISSTFFEQYERTSYDRAFLYNASAIAYQRAQDFENSERVFVLALHHILARTGGSWDLKDSNTEELFKDVISMYFVWQEKVCRDNDTTEADASLETALGVLAFSAGIGSDYINMYKEYLELVKAKYHRKKFAQQTLAVAVSAPVSVDKFRKTLRGCLNLKEVIQTHQHPSKGKSASDRRRDSKKAMRNYATQNAPTTRRFLRCCNPGCESTDQESKLMLCPCQTVSYCKKECQREDWKAHKKVCPKQRTTTS